MYYLKIDTVEVWDSSPRVPTIRLKLSNDSCMYSAAVVSALECRS
jgi:hypothetical protein